MSASPRLVVVDDDDVSVAEITGHLNALSRDLDLEAGKTVFAVGGHLPANIPVKIRWDQVKRDGEGVVMGLEPHKCHAVTLPASGSPAVADTDASMLEKLVRDCRPLWA